MSIVADFYDKFRYPPDRSPYARIDDPDLYRRLVMQEAGCGNIPLHADILVAGCGTRQALEVALQFPEAHVTGIDISRRAIDQCLDDARRLGRDIDLRKLSIEDVSTEFGSFDYIVCTGVIHHCEYPAIAIQKLRTVLRQTGILELMVYNRASVQRNHFFGRAVSVLAGPGAAMEKIWSTAKTILNEPCAVPDTYIHPLQVDFTLAELDDLANHIGLRILHPCFTPTNTGSWNISGLGDAQTSYDALDDLARWKVANFLLYERSPMLWFYLQRDDSPFRRMTVSELDSEFNVESWSRVSARLTYEDGHSAPFPGPLPQSTKIDRRMATRGMPFFLRPEVA